MNDTPGWASPGSAPSDGREPAPGEPAARPDGTAPPTDAGPDAASAGPGWAGKQPPPVPGQWSAPTGPPVPGQAPPPPQGWGHRPPAGPGGYPPPAGWGNGWGNGWGGPPPAAKPGVIPLRPLGVGEILDGAVSTMRTYWRTVLGISLTVAVVTEIVVVLLRGLVLDESTGTDALNDPDASLSELYRALGRTLVSSGVVGIVAMIGTIFATALLTTVTSRAVLGRSVSTGEAWRDARPQLPRLFGLVVLLLLVVVALPAVGSLPGILVAVLGASAGGTALAVLGGLAGLVVAGWLAIRFSLASPALMLEKQGIAKALTRSVKLVRGSWWRIFGIQLLATLIANIVASIVVIPFTVIAMLVGGDGGGDLFGTASGGDFGWTFLVISGVGSVIGSMITFPVTAGVSVLLYVDQRIRREALDLELARAAGVQDYGTNNTGAGPGN
ncbi:glycerophosphoryl diester phosphodiesterase membrane domain-containing protein [Streptomyces sp. NPDC090306]|uniref:glycerophosphoryl diester phosphodiesterase membrane domain-containing protein n=1 Tax=Streptomyces sp. NPDC090306 TaxID=3365961 RepID=UPI003820ECDA